MFVKGRISCKGTYEQIYGKEKADEMKRQKSEEFKRRHKDGTLLCRKGLTYEEIYGTERASEMRQKFSGRNNPMFGKPAWNRGKPAWNRGKKMNFTEEQKQKMRENGWAKKGKRLSEETKQKMRLAKKGKRLSEETKQKMRLSKLGNKNALGKHHSIESIKKRIEKRRKNKWFLNEKETKKRISESHKKLWQDPEHKKAAKIYLKKAWENPQVKERRIKAMLKGLLVRPTSLENKFINIIRRKNLPYKYVGDGDFIIGGKCPDFIHTSGLKRCIETRPKKTTHIWSGCSPEEYEKQRKEYFAKYGWDCSVVWWEDIMKY